MPGENPTRDDAIKSVDAYAVGQLSALLTPALAKSASATGALDSCEQPLAALIADATAKYRDVVIADPSLLRDPDPYKVLDGFVSQGLLEPAVRRLWAYYRPLSDWMEWPSSKGRVPQGLPGSVAEISERIDLRTRLRASLEPELRKAVVIINTARLQGAKSEPETTQATTLATSTRKRKLNPRKAAFRYVKEQHPRLSQAKYCQMVDEMAKSQPELRVEAQYPKENYTGRRSWLNDLVEDKTNKVKSFITRA